MSLDLYVDQPKPQPQPAPKAANSVPGWLSLVLVFGLGVFLALLLARYTPDDGGDDDGIKPTPTSGLHVLVLEETANRKALPSDQVGIFNSTTVLEWYEANCAKEKSGDVAYRRFDVDDKLDNEAEIWRKLREQATLEPPCVLMSKGKRAVLKPLPASPEAMIETLEKFKAGKK